MPRVDLLNDRLPDGGPVYFETCRDCAIVEPWAAASAVLFLVVVVFWIVRLRGAYRRHLFLSVCLPIMAVGGLGSVLYHGTRAHTAFFLMDVLPLPILCLAVSLYFWEQVAGKWWRLVAVLALPGLWGLRKLFGELSGNASVNVSYAMFALWILIPVVVLLVRGRGRGAGWIAVALMSVALAIGFRWLDTASPPLLPMGTHWLCHVFGAAASHSLIAYIFRLDRGTAANEQPRDRPL